MTTVSALDEALARAAGCGGPVELDLDGVDFIDGSGLSVLMDAESRARRSEPRAEDRGRLQKRAPSDRVHRHSRSRLAAGARPGRASGAAAKAISRATRRKRDAPLRSALNASRVLGPLTGRAGWEHTVCLSRFSSVLHRHRWRRLASRLRGDDDGRKARWQDPERARSGAARSSVASSPFVPAAASASACTR